MKRHLAIFTVLAVFCVPISGAAQVGGLHFENRTNHCARVSASSRDIAGNKHQHGTYGLRPGERVTINFGGARRGTLQAEVFAGARCEGEVIARPSYVTDVPGDRLKLVRLSQFQIVRE